MMFVDIEEVTAARARTSLRARGFYVVQTLDGEIKVKIPEGVSHGEVLRVKGKGVPYEKGRRGDLLIKINIKLPTKLSKEGRRMVEELRKEGI